MRVRFNEAALAGHGTGLADTATGSASAACGAPGADPVSAAAAATLTAHAQALGIVVEHAAVLRAVGGSAVAGTAGVLGGIDRDNATAIAGVVGDNHSAPVDAPQPPPVAPPPAPRVPVIPMVPAIAPLMSGEQWSTMIHGGPGSSGLRDFAEALRAHAGTLTDTADQVTGHGRGIDEHWDDGGQQAGANTTRHGHWLNNAATQANTIAAAADRVADSFDSTRNAVPPPHEFTAARQDILNAQSAANPVALTSAVQRYSGLQTQALDAVLTGYHPGTTSTLTGLPQPLPAAPPITHNGVQALGFGPGGAPEAPPTPPKNPADAAKERDEAIVKDPTASADARKLAQERLDDLRNAHMEGPLQNDPVMGGNARDRAQARLKFRDLLESGAAYPDRPPLTPDEATRALDTWEAKGRQLVLSDFAATLQRNGVSAEGVQRALDEVQSGKTPREILHQAGDDLSKYGGALAGGIEQHGGALPTGEHWATRVWSEADAKAMEAFGRRMGIAGIGLDSIVTVDGIANGDPAGPALAKLGGRSLGGILGAAGAGAAWGSLVGPEGTLIVGFLGGLGGAAFGDKFTGWITGG